MDLRRRLRQLIEEAKSNPTKLAIAIAVERTVDCLIRIDRGKQTYIKRALFLHRGKNERIATNNGDLRENSGFAKNCQVCRIQAVDSVDWVDCKEAHGVFQRKRWWRWLGCEAGVKLTRWSMVGGRRMIWSGMGVTMERIQGQSTASAASTAASSSSAAASAISIMAASTNIWSSTGYMPHGPGTG